MSFGSPTCVPDGATAPFTYLPARLVLPPLVDHGSASCMTTFLTQSEEMIVSSSAPRRSEPLRHDDDLKPVLGEHCQEPPDHVILCREEIMLR
jgi:hypothetical protein